MPPSHKKIYIPLSLVHLIYMAGDKCMRQNACLVYPGPPSLTVTTYSNVEILLKTCSVSPEKKQKSSIYMHTSIL